jgi:hypothetical protein
MPEIVTILDKAVSVEFLVGEAPPFVMDRNGLLGDLAEVARLINATAWTAEQRGAFNALEKIVFFEGVIRVNGYSMDRPCCDEDDRIFYWEASEFMANTDRAVRAHTLFHDCFHIIQYWRNRTFANGETERLAREVEAIDRQIEVAQRLGTDQSYITFLVNFKNDQERLKRRLAEGVRMVHDKDEIRPPSFQA